MEKEISCAGTLGNFLRACAEMKSMFLIIVASHSTGRNVASREPKIKRPYYNI